MATGSLGGATFTVRTEGVEDMVQRFSRMKQELNSLAAAQQDMGREMTRGAKQGSYAFLEMTRAIEDFQYGFNGVVNNIPQMALHLGLGAGVAGAASLAAVGINQLVQHWGELSDAMQGAWLGVATERLAKLREEAEAAAEGFEKLAKIPSKAEAAREKGITEAITEGPTRKVVEAVLEGVRRSDELKARPSKIPNIFGVTEEGTMHLNPQFRAEVEKRLDEENRKKAEGLVHNLRMGGDAGNKARKAIADMVNANPGAFPAGFLGDIENLDPARQAEQKKMEKQGLLNDANRHNLAARRAEAEKRRNHQGALLMQQGEQEMEKHARENARIGRKQQQEAERLKREQERHKEAIDRRTQSDLNKMLREDIEGPEKKRRRRGDSGFIGAVEFHKEMQAGALNNARDRMLKVQEDQLKALNAIRQQLAENPLPQAVAGAGMVGALAVMGGPN